MTLLTTKYYESININENSSEMIQYNYQTSSAIDPFEPEIVPQLSQSCVVSPIFCLDDGGEGYAQRSLNISTSIYGINETHIEMNPHDTWNLNFVAPKTEYYKFQIFTYPSSLSVIVKSNNQNLILGSTNVGYITTSNGTDEMLLNANQSYTINIVNNSNVTDCYVYLFRDDNSTSKHPATINGNSTIQYGIDYVGDIDYFKFYNTKTEFNLFSETNVNLSIDLKSKFYLCSNTSCSNKYLYSQSDNYYYESNNLFGNMSTTDFGYMLDLRNQYNVSVK